MKRSYSAAKNPPGPIVVEPDDKQEVDLFGERFFSPFRIFSPFRHFDLIDEFSDFDKNFENLEKKLGGNQKGYSVVQSMSSHVEYKDGKVVKDNRKGFYLQNDNGKGFIKVIKKTPEGNFEDRREFDFSQGRNVPRIK